MSPKFFVQAALIFAVIGLFTWVWQGRYDSGYNAATASMLKAVNTAVELAREDEQIKQGEVNEAAQKQFDAINSINAKLNYDLDRLRERSKRQLKASGSKATCKGATGADLSAEDAGFLTREAARADVIRTGLETCQNYADTVAK